MCRLKTLITVAGAMMVALGATWGSDAGAELGPPIVVAQAAPADGDAEAGEEAQDAPAGGTSAAREYAYDPSGRRDPFIPLVQRTGGEEKSDRALPPLQRVGLTEINLIGIIWGGFGYTAMVQTPDGKGYAVRRGTRIGPNNGIVSKVTQNGIFVTERYTDIYGKDQEREYVKLLHPSEESE